MATRGRWPLGVSSLGLPGAPLTEFLDLALAHGCRAVELRVADGEAVHLGLDARARADVRARCESSEVDVLALASYVKICGEAPVDDLLAEHLRLAADLGALGVRVFPGGDAPGAGSEAGVRRLETAADLAADLGVRVLVETHDSHPRGADVAALLDAVAGAHVGAVWDAVHPWVAGEEPAVTWGTVAPYLSHVQVKDVVERRPGARPALPGSGALPLDDVARVLAAAGYDAPLVLEWEKPWYDGLPGLEEALSAAERWLGTSA